MKSLSTYKSPIFNTVYLPDIWNMPDSTNINVILVLEALMDNCKLSKRGCSLLEFVRFLCKDVQNICLLRRGKTFENEKFVTLWPDVNIVGAVAKDLLPKDDMDWLQKIMNFSEKLKAIVLGLIEKQLDSGSKENYLAQIETLISEFDSLYDDDKIRNLIEQEEEINLNKFGNDISVVFHNKESNDSNMLFTGDIGAKYLEYQT